MQTVILETIENIADQIERALQARGEKEIPGAVVGEEVMHHLYDLDKVAYVRFSSVYRSFQDLDEFMSELKDLIQERSGAETKQIRRRSRSRAGKGKPTS